jgi:pimeloyl-ACP methyl ester carboxylesterase
MGSGLSEKPQHQTYSVETYVSQLSKFIDNFHLENPILVGHDVGGVIVTLYAVRNPGKVRKLIVMNAPVYPLSPPLSVRLMGAPVIGGLFSGDWAIRRIIRGGAVKQQSMTDSLLDAYLKPYHDDLGARAVLRKQLSELNLQPIVEKEIVPNLSKLQLPTLIMWGDGDPYVPLDFGKKLDEQIPDSSLYVVLNTGHFAIEERPEDVRQALKEFIDKQ